MDKCTHEVRKQRWKNIINQCMQRPEGMTAKQWLDENNICEQTYYHWLKRIRQETYELAASSPNTVPVNTMSSEAAFAEVPLHKTLRFAPEPDARWNSSVLPDYFYPLP